MNRTLISFLLTGLFGLYCGNANAGSFTDGTGAAAGTVADNITNLVWQKCSAGLVSTPTCTNTPSPAITPTWTAGISYCEVLSLGGFTDWRLPNAKELSSLVDDTRFNPSIDPLFPNTLSSGYWLSTTNAGNTPNAWYVDFNDGSVVSYFKGFQRYVRCVRGQ